MKNALFIAALAISAAAASVSASAQYPGKPVRLILPVPAGGASDTAARTLAQALSKPLGQPVVVENRPGANGAIAAQALMAASPDGHTLLWGIASMVALPLLQKDAPFESLADLTPISMVGRLTFAVFVHPGVPAKSVAELIAYARAHPDGLSYASGTLGEFMSTAQFIKTTGVSMVRVPYKGGAQAMPDLVAGRVQVYVTPISLGLPYAKEGRLRLLATLVARRSQAAPDVPTLAEAGVKGVSVPTWQAIFGPPKTPREIVERVSRETHRVLQDPAVRAQFDRQTLQIEDSTPEALAAIVREDARTWSQFIRENGITPE